MNSRATLLVLAVLALVAVLGAVWLLRGAESPPAATPTAITTPGPAPERSVTLPTPGAGKPSELQPSANSDTQTPGPSVRPAAPAAEVTGRIIDRGGQPQAQARLTGFLSTQAPPFRTRKDLGITSTTGSDGRFLLSGLPADATLGLEVAHADFAPAIRETFSAPAGRTLDLGDIILEDGLTLLGNVTGVDGRALAGAEVSLADVERQQRGDTSPALVTQTDADGRYTFRHLALRQYELQARVADYAPVSIVLSLVLGTADGTWRQDFRLERADHDLRGLVLDNLAQSVPDLPLRISQRHAGSNTYFLQTITTGTDGRFELRSLAQGRYEIALQSSRFYLDQPMELPADGVERTLRVQPALVVHGQLECDGELPDRFHVRARPDGRTGAALLGGAQIVRTFSGTQPRGAFVFDGLRPGSYRFEVRAEGFAVTTTSDVIIGAEAPRVDVFLFLMRGGGIRGRLSSGGAGQLVELRGNDYDPSLSIEATFPTLPVHELAMQTNETGAFLLEHVPPGDYTLSARPTGAPPIHVRDVQVTDETTTDVGTLEVSAGAVLYGNVLGTDGLPSAGVRVSVTTAQHQQQTITNASGDFRITQLPAGDYEVVATPGNLWQALQFEGRQRLTLLPGDELPVLLMLAERAPATPR